MMQRFQSLQTFLIENIRSTVCIEYATSRAATADMAILLAAEHTWGSWFTGGLSVLVNDNCAFLFRFSSSQELDFPFKPQVSDANVVTLITVSDSLACCFSFVTIVGGRCNPYFNKVK